MSTVRINATEKDVEKYFKFLAFKMVQVIVQSRLGAPAHTVSNPNGGSSDWFNLVIHDHPEILNEIRHVFNSKPTDSILQRMPFSIEFSLKTAEDDTMVLEVWTLDLVSDQKDPHKNEAHVIYNRMGLLLKSLLSISRALPSYKLSKYQTKETFLIHYALYLDEPHTAELGEGHKQIRIGQLSTSIGTLSMSVAYRTKMTISPTPAGRDNSIILKSDHFVKDFNPKNIRYNNLKKSDQMIIDINKPLRAGAFVDTSKIKTYTEEDYILPETPPFSWLIRTTKDSSQENSVEDDNNQIVFSDTNSTGTTSPGTAINNNNNLNSDNEINNCENGKYKLPHSSPQNGVCPLNKSNSSNGTSVSSTNIIKSLLVSAPVEDINKRQNLNKSEEDDESLLKELNFPFAETDSKMGDLARFYRECHNAPPLQSCIGNQPSDTVDDLAKQLEQFETSLNDYEKLVKSLGCSVLDSNSNS